MSVMYWNSDTTRHARVSNNPYRRGIESANEIRADIPASPDAQTPQVGEVYDEPTVEVESPDDDGFPRASGRRTAGFQPQNWREYPGGTGNEFQNADGDWVDVQADYFDALYPEENPSAIWDGSYVYVFDGTGEIILNKEAYSFQEAQQIGNKALEKAYKGEAKPEQGQGMFFRTPGKGKLFSNRRTAADWNWDEVADDVYVLDEGGRQGRVEDDGDNGFYWAVEAENGDTLDSGQAVTLDEAFANAERVLRTGSVVTAGWGTDPDDPSNEQYTNGAFSATILQRASDVAVMYSEGDSVLKVDGKRFDTYSTIDEAKEGAQRTVDAWARGSGAYPVTEGKRRTASWSLLDQVNTAPLHRVAGWDWDHQIEGYVCDGISDFACVCGSNVEAPGHIACECGKIWNSYVVSANGGTRLICREVPVRENVLLARKGREGR